MPRKTEWTHRIEGAIARLETLSGDGRVDRAALEQLLSLSPRRALRFGGKRRDSDASAASFGGRASEASRTVWSCRPSRNRRGPASPT